MSPERKKLAEQVTQKFKSSQKSILNSQDFRDIFNDSRDYSSVIKSLIEDYGFLSRVDTTSFRLNNLGWEFKSFDSIESEKKERKEIEKRKLSVDLQLAERTLESYPKTRSRAIWAFRIAIGLVIIEIIKLIFFQTNAT